MAEKKAWDGDGVPLEDSNCAGIGSEEDKAARKNAAQTEPQWHGVGLAPGLKVWRIENFQVVPVDPSSYGKFHTGDSYIILETVMKASALERHIYFWLGTQTTADEMGTAAYKTVELDDYFDGEPTQSREVQHKESSQFRALFPKLTYLEGGVDSGFHHTIADVYQARLFQVRKIGKGGVVEQEVELSRESLNDGDAFVLDAGKKIYVFQGGSAHPLEKYEAMLTAQRLERQRGGHAAVKREPDAGFWELLGGEGPVRAASEAGDRMPPPQLGEGVLYALSDAEGELEMREVGRRALSKSMLDPDEVMILDHGAEIFVWIGGGASTAERRNAYRSSQRFLTANGRDPQTPTHVYKEGCQIRNEVWNAIFAK